MPALLFPSSQLAYQHTGAVCFANVRIFWRDAVSMFHVAMRFIALRCVIQVKTTRSQDRNLFEMSLAEFEFVRFVILYTFAAVVPFLK